MNSEPTKEEKLRASSLACLVCNSRILIGPNYPPGVILPATLEVWCVLCKVISVYTNVNEK